MEVAAAVAGKADMPDKAAAHLSACLDSLGCQVVERSAVEAHAAVDTVRLGVSSTCSWAIQSLLFFGGWEDHPDRSCHAAVGSALAPVRADSVDIESKLHMLGSEQLVVDLAAAETELTDMSGDCLLATHSRPLLAPEGFRCSMYGCCSA